VGKVLVVGCCLLAMLLAGGWLGVEAARGASPDPLLAGARLQGQFLLVGRVTAATRVGGERRGQGLLRTWTFLPGCPAGPCSVVGLVRERTAGTDKLLLTRRGAGSYTGQGIFYVPLRCGRRTYPRGEAVPFTVTVQVTATTVVGGVLLASHVNATYLNRSRQNLTPCLTLPGHDAASYLGTLAMA
jgi:hypothetical protein